MEVEEPDESGRACKHDKRSTAHHLAKVGLVRGPSKPFRKAVFAKTGYSIWIQAPT